MAKIGEVYTYQSGEVYTYQSGDNDFRLASWFRHGTPYLIKDIDRNTVEITTETLKTAFVSHEDFLLNFELAEDQKLFDLLEVDKPILDKFGVEIKVGSYVLYSQLHRVVAIEYKADGSNFMCKLLSENKVIETSRYIRPKDEKIDFSCVVFHPKIVDYLEYRGMSEDYERFVNDLDKVESL